MASDQDIYRNWLREQLDRRGRGARKALADFMGFERPDVITRMLNTDPKKEMRQIRAFELARMVEFFGTTPPNMAAPAAPGEQGEDGPQLDEAISIYDRLPEPLKKVFLKRVLGLLEPDQSQRPESIGRASNEKSR